MEQRLEAAAYSGDVTLLRQLLQEDARLLHRQASDDTPLHVAASLGHLLFLQEVLAVNPDLACARNRQGQTALHLAAVQGHLSVVKELLLACKDNAKQVCSAQDNEGFMPVHTAAVHGRNDVLKELLHTCPESAKARTAEGDSVFHLAAKSNCFETVQFLLDWNEVITSQLLKSTDEKGNTTLHVAVARKQLRTVKLLLGQEGVQVNARNKRDFTALDVLIESPAQHGDLVLGEQIRVAGGKTSAELQGGQCPDSPPQKDVESFSSTGSRLSRWRRWRRYWGINKEDHNVDDTEKYNNKPGTLMVVATLIATITFQAGLNPPGGFKQNDNSSLPPGTSNDETYIPCRYSYYFYCWRNQEGQAVLASYLSWFLVFDMIGLFASLSIILLLICCVPTRKKMVVGFLKWILWLAVFFTALAFSTAIKQIFVFERSTSILLFSWFILLSIFVVWVCFRGMRFLLRKGGCWKDKRGRNKQSQTGPTKTVAIITKTGVGISLIILLGGFCYLGVPIFEYLNK